MSSPTPGTGAAPGPRPRLLLRGLDDLLLSVRCGICLESIRGPVLTRCGHVFCRLCLHRAVDAAVRARARDEAGPTGSKAKCPQCNAANLTKRSLTDDVDTEKVLGALKCLKQAIAKEAEGSFDFDPDSDVAANSPKKASSDTVDLFSGESLVPVVTPVDLPKAIVDAAAAKRNSSGAFSVPTIQKTLISRREKGKKLAPVNVSKSSKRREMFGGKVSFQLMGKVVSTVLDVTLGQRHQKTNNICVFVQLGRLARKRPLSESFPDFAEILERHRKRGAPGNDRQSIPSNDKKVKVGDSGDLNEGHLLNALADTASTNLSNTTVPSTSSTANPSQGGRVSKKGKRVSKNKLVKAALKKSSENAAATTQEGGGRRRRSSGGRLNSAPRNTAEKEASEDLSIHTSSNDLDKAIEGQNLPAQTGAEFMRRIIVNVDDDLYTTEKETTEEATERINRLKNLGNESDDKELTLEEGRLQSRRRKTKRRMSDSSNVSSLRGASPSKPLSLDSYVESPVKSEEIGRAVGDIPSAVPPRTSPRYSVSQAPSATEFAEKKADMDDDENAAIMPVSQASSVDMVAATSTLIAYPPQSNVARSRVLKKAALASIENVKVKATSSKTTTEEKEQITRVFVNEDPENGQEEDVTELPDLIPDSVNLEADHSNGQARPKKLKGSEDTTSIRVSNLTRRDSNTTATTNESDAEMSTEEIKGRLKELESVANNHDSGGSDDDIFGSTPEAKKRKRIRMLPQGSSDTTLVNTSRAKKKLNVDHFKPSEALPDLGKNQSIAEDSGETTNRTTDLVESQGLSSKPTATASSLDPSVLRSYVLMPTGIDTGDKEMLQQFMDLAGCSKRTALDDSVTHVLVRHDEGLKAERTLKYLQAIIKGKMIVGMRWIRDSLEMKAMLLPDDYEVLDLMGENGPERARKARQDNLPGVFSKFEFVLLGKFGSINSQQMRLLLIGAGGKVLRSSSLFSYDKNVYRLIIVDREADASMTADKCAMECATSDAAVVDRDWVIESLGAYRTRGVGPFLAHHSSGKELKIRCGLGEELLPEEPSMNVL